MVRRILLPTSLGLLVGLLVEILLKNFTGWGISLASLSAGPLLLVVLITVASLGLGLFLWVRAKTSGRSLITAGL